MCLIKIYAADSHAEIRRSIRPECHSDLNFERTTKHCTVYCTVHNSSCGKVMFLLVSVCPQGGGVHP